jgi:hypothetical protein
MTMTRQARCVAALLAALLAACGESPTMPHPSPTPPASPTPDPTTQVVPIAGTGRVRIEFAGANVAPGSTVSGCGVLIEGCAGRLRMSFDLHPTSTGHALFMRVFVHATNQIACLWGETGEFDLQAGVVRRIEIPFDNADRCGVPVTIATMDAGVEGTIEVASRQEWALHYVFAP